MNSWSKQGVPISAKSTAYLCQRQHTGRGDRQLVFLHCWKTRIPPSATSLIPLSETEKHVKICL